MFVFPGLVYLLRQMISPDGLLSFRATTSSPSVTSPCSRLSLGAEKSWQRRCFHSHHNKDKLGIGIRCNRKQLPQPSREGSCEFKKCVPCLLLTITKREIHPSQKVFVQDLEQLSSLSSFPGDCLTRRMSNKESVS